MRHFSLVAAVSYAKAKPKMQCTAPEAHLILVRLAERMKAVSRVIHSRPAGAAHCLVPKAEILGLIRSPW